MVAKKCLGSLRENGSANARHCPAHRPTKTVFPGQTPVHDCFLFAAPIHSQSPLHPSLGAWHPRGAENPRAIAREFTRLAGSLLYVVDDPRFPGAIRLPDRHAGTRLVQCAAWLSSCRDKSIACGTSLKPNASISLVGTSVLMSSTHERGSSPGRHAERIGTTLHGRKERRLPRYGANV